MPSSTSTMPTEPRSYLPALRFPALTRLYDPVVGLTTRERRFKELLVDQAAPSPGQRILDLGCGTGTLAIQVKQREPQAEVVGLDADPEMLAQARAKAERADIELSFAEGMSDELPFEDASFDRVLSTLFFHHLDPEPKRRTAREIARVLRKGGELHVADWGEPADPVMAAAFISHPDAGRVREHGRQRQRRAAADLRGGRLRERGADAISSAPSSARWRSTAPIADSVLSTDARRDRSA